MNKYYTCEDILEIHYK